MRDGIKNARSCMKSVFENFESGSGTNIAPQINQLILLILKKKKLIDRRKTKRNSKNHEKTLIVGEKH